MFFPSSARVPGMQWRCYDYVRKYTPQDLSFIEGMVAFSGIRIAIRDLSDGGWICVVTKRRNGGRTNVRFRSADGRSVISFKLDRGGREEPEDPFSKLVGGALTSVDKPLRVWSDGELLDALAKNAKLRRKHRKTRATPVDEKRLSRVLEAA